MQEPAQAGLSPKAAKGSPRFQPPGDVAGAGRLVAEGGEGQPTVSTAGQAPALANPIPSHTNVARAR